MMKNIVKNLMLLSAMMIALVSCKDKASLVDAGEPVSPQTECQGTFNGVWTVTKTVGKKDPVVSETNGSITLTPDISYVTKVTASCPEQAIDWTIQFNINPRRNDNGGYQISNYNTKNAIGASVLGFVDKDNNLTLSYQLITKQGRDDVTTDYVFAGSK